MENTRTFQTNTVVPVMENNEDSNENIIATRQLNILKHSIFDSNSPEHKGIPALVLGEVENEIGQLPKLGDLEKSGNLFHGFDIGKKKILQKIVLIEGRKKNKRFILDPTCTVRRIWDVVSIMYFS